LAKNPSEGYAYLLLPLTCFCPGEEALSEYLAEGQAVWGPGGGGKQAPGDEQHQDADVTAEDEGSVAEMGASVAKDVMAEIFQDEVEDDRPDAHCTLHTAHCTLHTTLYTAHCTLEHLNTCRTRRPMRTGWPPASRGGSSPSSSEKCLS
jgi:hypothetical protein